MGGEEISRKGFGRYYCHWTGTGGTCKEGSLNALPTCSTKNFAVKPKDKLIASDNERRRQSV